MQWKKEKEPKSAPEEQTIEFIIYQKNTFYTFTKK